METNTSALLVMDIQKPTINMLNDSSLFMHSINTAIQKARSFGMPVIFVVIGFRKGYPEISVNNKSFNALKTGAMHLDSPENNQVHELVSIAPNDIVITKKRVSAFAGSDLELVLRSLGIKHIILSGISTSGVVLSTLREAADKDYAITVLSNCCADLDEEVHRVLTTKIFPKQAQVMDVAEWAVSIK